MKRTKVVVLTLMAAMMLLLVGCGASKKGIFGDNDFRNVKWGVDADAVRDSEEDDPFLDTDPIIHYDDQTFEGYDAVISYNFFDGVLRKGGVMMTADDEEEAQKIYDEMNAVLEKGYGKSVGTVGKLVSYKNDTTVVEIHVSGSRVDLMFYDASTTNRATNE